MSHTKGKLAADGSLIKSQNGEMVAGTVAIASPEVGQSSHEANTRRLVACWNALEGVPTEWLENYVFRSVENVIQENAALKQERDELFHLAVLMNATFEDVWAEYEQSVLKKDVHSILAKYEEKI